MEQIKCPNCGKVDSSIKNGFRAGKQRYKCKSCGNGFYATPSGKTTQPKPAENKTKVEDIVSKYEKVAKYAIPMEADLAPDELPTDIVKVLRKIWQYYPKCKTFGQLANKLEQRVTRIDNALKAETIPEKWSESLKMDLVMFISIDRGLGDLLESICDAE